jgi:hypothetical protein
MHVTIHITRTAPESSIFLALGILFYAASASAAPSAEVAKRCVHYAYIAYPWKRPGVGPQSGDRQAYINDCFSKNGDVAKPKGPVTK